MDHESMKKLGKLISLSGLPLEGVKSNRVSGYLIRKDMNSEVPEWAIKYVISKDKVTFTLLIRVKTIGNSYLKQADSRSVVEVGINEKQEEVVSRLKRLLIKYAETLALETHVNWR